MSKKTRVSSEDGAALIFTVIVLLLLLAMSALAIDLGVLYVAAQQCQNTADAAALAGARQLKEGLIPEEAADAAIETALNNKVLNDPVVLQSADIKVGAWDAATKQVVDWDPEATAIAVQVTVRRTNGSPNGPVPTFFAKVLGWNSMQTSRTAVAGLFLQEIQRQRPPLELIIVQDASGSFKEEWHDAINADKALLNLVNDVSISGDRAGLVAFSQELKRTRYVGLDGYGRPDRSLGSLRRTDQYGNTVQSGGVLGRNLQMGLTDFNYADHGPPHGPLPSEMDRQYQVFYKDNPGGNTYPELGLNWAIDQLTQHGVPGSDKVIVFVSDGMPNPSSQHHDPTNEAARRAGLAGIKIHSVTLTNESVIHYGTEGADYEFNRNLVETYNVDSDGNSLGGYALATSDPAQLVELLELIAETELGKPRLLR